MRCIPKHFILVDVVVIELVFLILFSDCLLLALHNFVFPLKETLLFRRVLGSQQN